MSAALEAVVELRTSATIKVAEPKVGGPQRLSDLRRVRTRGRRIVVEQIVASASASASFVAIAAAHLRDTALRASGRRDPRRRAERIQRTFEACRRRRRRTPTVAMDARRRRRCARAGAGFAEHLERDDGAVSERGPSWSEGAENAVAAASRASASGRSARSLHTKRTRRIREVSVGDRREIALPRAALSMRRSSSLRLAPNWSSNGCCQPVIGCSPTRDVSRGGECNGIRK